MLLTAPQAPAELHRSASTETVGIMRLNSTAAAGNNGPAAQPASCSEFSLTCFYPAPNLTEGQTTSEKSPAVGSPLAVQAAAAAAGTAAARLLHVFAPHPAAVTAAANHPTDPCCGPVQHGSMRHAQVLSDGTCAWQAYEQQIQAKA
jgi:hypothetical protein